MNTNYDLHREFLQELLTWETRENVDYVLQKYTAFGVVNIESKNNLNSLNAILCR